MDAVEILKVLAGTVIPWCGHGPYFMVLFNGGRYIITLVGWHAP